MDEIVIEGLTEQQRFLADMIWLCDTEAQCEQFITGLPTVALRSQAWAVKQLLILTVLDQHHDQQQDLADQIIDKARRSQ